jgi:hypothetical protein
MITALQTPSDMTNMKEIADHQRILSVIDNLPDREYQNKADVGKSLGQML